MNKSRNGSPQSSHRSFGRHSRIGKQNGGISVPDDLQSNPPTDDTKSILALKKKHRTGAMIRAYSRA